MCMCLGTGIYFSLSMNASTDGAGKSEFRKKIINNIVRSQNTRNLYVLNRLRLLCL